MLFLKLHFFKILTQSRQENSNHYDWILNYFVCDPVRGRKTGLFAIKFIYKG
jgi:hypothetical protein